MTNIMLLLDAFVFTLAFADIPTDEHVGKVRPSLVHLFRSKRFDFSMFGCSDCRPMIQCRSDHECVVRNGHGHSCEFKCCSFVCSTRRTASVSDYFKIDDTFDDVTENSRDQDEENEVFSTDVPEEDVNLDHSDTNGSTINLLTSTISMGKMANLHGESDDLKP